MKDVVRLHAGSVPPWPGAVIAVGNFDGVHRGHQALVAAVVAAASARGETAAVLTFDPHPARVLAPQASPMALMTVDQKAAALFHLGIEAVAILPFTREVAAATPEEFAADVLGRALAAKAVVVGSNFRFGRARGGDVATLRGQGARVGFDVIEVAPVIVAGETVSSSRIRDALGRGDVRAAAALLGRAYAIEGPVVTGEGRGRTIGVPTANVQPDNEMLPALGVYAAWCWTEGAGGGCPAVVNVGRRPTFGTSGAVSVEAHLLDFAGDLYGQRLGVSFVSRLRGEQKFAGADALVAQIRDDVAAARGVLGGARPASRWDAL